MKLFVGIAFFLLSVCMSPALGFCDGPCVAGENLTGNVICWYNGTCCAEGKCWTGGVCYRDGACCWGNGTCCVDGKCDGAATCYMSNRLCCAQAMCWENATCYQNGTCCAGGYCWSKPKAETEQVSGQSTGSTAVISRERSLELLQEFSRTRERIDISDRPRPQGPRPGDQDNQPDQDVH
jgi:hypothetical protein